MRPPILTVVFSLTIYYNYDLLIGLIVKTGFFPPLMNESTVNRKPSIYRYSKYYWNIFGRKLPYVHTVPSTLRY